MHRILIENVTHHLFVGMYYLCSRNEEGQKEEGLQVNAAVKGEGAIIRRAEQR